MNILNLDKLGIYNLDILYSLYTTKNQIIFLGHIIEEYYILTEWK